MRELRRSINVINIRPDHLAPMQGPVAFSRINNAIADPHFMDEPVQLTRLNGNGARLGRAVFAEGFLEGAARWGQMTRVASGVRETQRNLVAFDKHMVSLSRVTRAHAPDTVLVQNGIPPCRKQRDSGSALRQT